MFIDRSADLCQSSDEWIHRGRYTDYLQNLINNVLDISKLESGSLVLEHKSFDLVELLSNNLTVVAMSAYENGARFEGGVEASIIRHRYLIGSPIHLSRVLMNLSFQFICSDTGLGMSEARLRLRFHLR